MAALGKIVAHRDLTDVAFVANALGTSFKVDVKPGGYEKVYATDRVLGSPISARLTVFDAAFFRDHKMAVMFFPAVRDDRFIQTCLRIGPRDYSSYFGGGFTLAVGPPPEAYPFPGLDGPLPRSATAFKQTAGKDGSGLVMTFGWDADEGLVDGIALRQWQKPPSLTFP
jgi:hypothetical protein